MPVKTRVPDLPRKADQERRKLMQAVKNMYFIEYKQTKDSEAASDAVDAIVVDALLEAEADQDNV